MNTETIKEINALKERVGELEKWVSENKSQPKTKDGKDYRGPSGGLRLLLSEGFFNTPRSSSEFQSEIERQGYH